MSPNRTYGITPEEYKKTRPMLNTVIKPEISMNYVLIDEGVPLIIGDIVLEIQRKNLSTTESYIGFAADVNPAIGLGMSYMAEPEKGIFQYFAGALLQGKADSTNDFVMKELLAGDYIVCKIEAENFENLVTEALDKAGKYLSGTCMEIWVMPIPHSKGI